MRKDAVIAAVVLAAIIGLCYFLYVTHPPTPPPSKAGAADASSSKSQATDKVVMHVNGEPVTEAELSEAFRSLPENVQQQFGNTPASQAFAEQYVKLKLLAVEGQKMGVDKDPHVKAQLSAEQTNVLAGATLQKLVTQPADPAVQAFYNENRKDFESVELSHIVLGYQGSMIPPRNGGQPPSEDAARAKAQELYLKVKGGADFAQVAHDFSDDPNSAQSGGKLGPFTKGMLPPEIEAQVFSLAPGQVSPPLPSRYGIHLFKAGVRAVQPLDKVRPFIVQKLQQKMAADRIDALYKGAKLDFDSKFFPDQKTWKAPGAGKSPS